MSFEFLAYYFASKIFYGKSNGQYENWGKCQQLIPYVEPLINSEPAAEEALDVWPRIPKNTAR